MFRSSLIACTALMLTATPALADCEDSFKNLQELTANAALSSEVRRDMNDLRSAARTLSRYDKGDACEEVIESIEEIVKSRKEAHERQMQKERFSNATPVGQLNGLVRVDDIKGKDVHDPTGKEIGVIEAVTIDSDKGGIAYVVLSHGGFLGIGEKLTPIPWSELRMTDKRDALVLPLSESKLKNAPSFDDDNWPTMTDPTWRAKIDSYYAAKEKG